MKKAAIFLLINITIFMYLPLHGFCDIRNVEKYSADFNSDGKVDAGDLIIFSDHWLQIPADPNMDICPDGGDGFLNMQDYATFSIDWLSNSALLAAQTGMDYALDILAETPTIQTPFYNVTENDAAQVWNKLCSHLQGIEPGGHSVTGPSVFNDLRGDGVEIFTSGISCGVGDVSCILRFYRYDFDPTIIYADSTGMNGGSNRKLTAKTLMKIFNYAVISRGRVHLTGDTSIYGDVCSTWDRADISPYHAASDTCVLGTFNTILTKEAIAAQGYQLETLDNEGNPIFDENGDRIYSPDDEIQGYHRGINYRTSMAGSNRLPGLDISDYDTDFYLTRVRQLGNGDIPASGTVVREYFPHGPDGYDDYKNGARTVNRHVYENMTFCDVRLPDNRNALFRNCTFENVLYIDCSKGTGYYNNVRFEDCTFHGVIVTDTPQVFRWQYNVLYFTGSANFKNTSCIQGATILAPHFNIELGSMKSDARSDITSEGTIVGGIVDIRGKAEIIGKVVAMCDTTGWSAGYINDIGDTESGFVSTINIRALPSDKSPIVIDLLQVYESE